MTYNVSSGTLSLYTTTTATMICLMVRSVLTNIGGRSRQGYVHFPFVNVCLSVGQLHCIRFV